jgi:hypothetical protein
VLSVFAQFRNIALVESLKELVQLLLRAINECVERNVECTEPPAQSMWVNESGGEENEVEFVVHHHFHVGHSHKQRNYHKVHNSASKSRIRSIYLFNIRQVHLFYGDTRRVNDRWARMAQWTN